MADVGVSQPRRKVMTYGRTSRMRNLTPLKAEKNSSPKQTHTSKPWFTASNPAKLLTRAVKPTATKDSGVFDVPSSDEEASAPISQVKVDARTAKRRNADVKNESRRQTSPAASVGSSDGSRKRKRASPSKPLPAALDALAQRAPSKKEPPSLGTSASATTTTATLRQRAKARTVVNKPVVTKSKNVPTKHQSRRKIPNQAAVPSSSSAHESMLVEPATSISTEKNTLGQGFAIRMNDKSQISSNEMELEQASATPPSLSPDRNNTPQMLLNTPRQSRQWRNILRGDDSPSTKNERLDSRPSFKASSAVCDVGSNAAPSTSCYQSIPSSNNTEKPQRMKLVQSLIGHRPVLDFTLEGEDESSEYSSESQDAVMEDPPHTRGGAEIETEKSVQTETATRRVGASHNDRARITYADKKRSFLSAPPTDFDQILAAPLDEFGFTSQGQQSTAHFQGSAMQGAEGLTDEEDIEEEGPSMRSAHELQALGSNRRFVDKLDALLDDVNQLHGTSRSAQRSALMELGEKMMAKDHLTRFLRLDYDQKLFSGFNGHLDPISDFLWTSLVAIIAHGGATAHILERMCRGTVVNSLVLQLDTTKTVNAITKDRKTNMSKMVREDLFKFCDSLRQEYLWGSQIPGALSPRLMALKSLDLLIRKSRESGSMEAVLEVGHIQKLVTICQEISKESDEVCQSPAQRQEVELALSILESDSIHLVGSIGENNWSSDSLSNLADSTHIILQHAGAKDWIIESLLLRLCLNVTNNNPTICEIFSTPDIVAALARSVTSKFAQPLDTLDEELRASLLDRLILCLGTLINLAEFSETARLSLIVGSADLVKGLLNTFSVGLKRATEAESIEQTQINVAYGYLAVYLANLCESSALRQRIRLGLPEQRIDALVAAVQEFIKLNMMVDQEKYDGDEGQAVLTAFTARLQTVLSRLRASAE
ncbi:MAG: hypothetical protein M1822_002137 [Bathelium mastoideum]|nr:MAG: hypothetical protein M1822_002137 [Bathelium mastoideum]